MNNIKEKLKELTKRSDEETSIIDKILNNHFIIGKNNKEKIMADFMEKLNPNSLTVVNGYVEESLKDTKPLDHYQFVRNGYYVTDKDSTKDKLVFNCNCGLKSSFKL